MKLTLGFRRDGPKKVSAELAAAPHPVPLPAKSGERGRRRGARTLPTKRRTRGFLRPLSPLRSLRNAERVRVQRLRRRTGGHLLGTGPGRSGAVLAAELRRLRFADVTGFLDDCRNLRVGEVALESLLIPVEDH